MKSLVPCVIIVLLSILAGAVFVGHYGWVSAGNVVMPAWGWLMMGLGIFFTVVVGGGLMALIFYSSRAGFDQAPELEPEPTATPETDVPMRNRRKADTLDDQRDDKQPRERVTRFTRDQLAGCDHSLIVSACFLFRSLT
jgi:hypothetical protein